LEAIIGGMVEIIPASGCWEWQGAKTAGGYGAYGNRYIHRFVWETLRGPIEPGMVVHHHCENRLCCNPAHLETMERGDHSAHHATLRSR
jgi:hypothetical protein